MSNGGHFGYTHSRYNIGIDIDLQTPDPPCGSDERSFVISFYDCALDEAYEGPIPDVAVLRAVAEQAFVRGFRVLETNESLQPVELVCCCSQSTDIRELGYFMVDLVQWMGPRNIKS